MILYNRPTSSRPKKKYDKQSYAELSNDGRIVHQLLGDDVPSSSVGKNHYNRTHMNHSMIKPD